MKHWHFIAQNEIALNLHQFYYDEIVGLGGWSSKNVIEEKDKVYIEINLIETVNDTDEYNTLTNREKIIIEKSEKFISKEKIKEQNLEFQSDDLDKSHLLIITFNGDPNVDYSKIEQALANSKLEYKLEADVSSTAEVGASGGWRRFLIALVGDSRFKLLNLKKSRDLEGLSKMYL